MKNNRGRWKPALVDLIKRSPLDALAALLTTGFDPNQVFVRERRPTLTYTNDPVFDLYIDYTVPLTIACLAKDVRKIRLLINAGADVNFNPLSHDGSTFVLENIDTRKVFASPLHSALRSDHDGIIRLLVRLGATYPALESDLDFYRRINGRCPLRGLDPEALARLGRGLSEQDERRLLGHAIETCDERLLGQLAARGSSFDEIADSGESPLWKAVPLGLPDMIDTVLRLGADIHRQNADGESALFLALRIGNIPVIERLLSRGASLSVPNKQGRTALQVAHDEAERSMAIPNVPLQEHRRHVLSALSRRRRS